VAEFAVGEEKMATSKSYTKELIRELKDPREAAEYLSTALEDGNMEVFLLALKDVAEALGGGFSKLSRKTRLNRENLYRMLSEKGNPELRSMGALLDALGLKLTIDVKKAS
jgi:probable addiction module antidote protein